MAQVIIRNLDEDVVQRLKDLAKRHGRSLESELRDVVTKAAIEDRATWLEWVQAHAIPSNGPDAVELIRRGREERTQTLVTGAKRGR